MAQVGHTGSTQNKPVDYSSHAAGLSGSESLEQVSKGDLDGQNIRFSRQSGGKDILQGQQLRAPVLEQPDEVKPTHLEAANEDVTDISNMTENALNKTSSLLKNAQAGTLTSEQQESIQEHAETLGETAEYLDNLRGNNLINTAGKKRVLAGMGFNEQQMEALLSLANPDDAENSLASLHGGTESLQNKKDSLKAMGFSDSQIEALLALANPNDEENNLDSTHQAGAGSKDRLTKLGFSSREADRLLILALGYNSAETDRVLGQLAGTGEAPGSEEQKQLLMSMGFSEEAAEMMLALADPELLLAQESLIRSSEEDQILQLQKAAAAANALSTGSPVGDRVLKQLADIFMVLELLHEMSVQGRRTARETRAIEYDAAKQEILNQSQEMRKAAVMTLVGGVVSGTMKVAAGATTMAGTMGRANQTPAQSQVSLQRSMQASQMISGAGDLGAAGFNYQSSQHSARQKEHEAFQKTHDNAAQSESEWMQLQQDMVKTVQSKMDEIIRTWFETLKTTTRG